MTVAVVSQGTEGPKVDIFYEVDEAFVAGERVIRPQSSTILVVA